LGFQQEYASTVDPLIDEISSADGQDYIFQGSNSVDPIIVSTGVTSSPDKEILEGAAQVTEKDDQPFTNFPSGTGVPDKNPRVVYDQVYNRRNN
jgi:hypothetical protein